ncbi:mitochondrial glycerol-3-phosphate dehydrogenase [Coelomomyces lativittatus]|nr:mitochondrial glycerol-3-phosphate dehydrogenase [Coelomomyces lativittatus]
MWNKETFPVYAKGIINATGPFTDAIRLLDDPSASPIVTPSSGVHIVLPNYYSPSDMGLLDPHTSDGRVIFFLPWEHQTIAGTTDTPCKVEAQPKPSETEILWLLDEIKRYLNKDIQVRRGDVLAAWSGIRPLVKHPNKTTAGLVRHHMLHVTPTGLLTIAGGKWTTYRAMAEDTVNLAISTFGLQPTLSQSVTEQILLVGTHGYSPTLFIRLIQHFGLDTEVAKHLTQSYGDKSWIVASYAAETGHAWPIFGRKLVPGFPYLEAEVYHGLRNEYACTLTDMVARRLRLAFLNAHLAYYALPKILDIMAKELVWDDDRRKQEYCSAVQFLDSMGLTPIQRTHLTKSELTRVKDQFYATAASKGGVLTRQECQTLTEEVLQHVHPSIMESCLAQFHEEVFEFQDFLQFLVFVKETKDEKWKSDTFIKEKETVQVFPPINTDRAGGGV